MEDAMNRHFITGSIIFMLIIFLVPTAVCAEDTNIIFKHDQTGIADEVNKIKEFDYNLFQREIDRIEAENLENSTEAMQVGDTYYERGELDDAIIYYQIAIKMDPSNAAAHEKYIEARQQERAQTSSHYHQAMEYYREGIPDKAVDELIAEIRENPNNEQARIKLNEIEAQRLR
jgi:tetratricopeptide (TPR) repeat protein